MKDISLSVGFSGPQEKELEFTLEDLLGNKKITPSTKLKLTLGVHEGSYGASFSVAKVELNE